MRENFEYNDEYYYSDAESGIPYKICQSKEEAKTLCEKMNALELKGVELSSYSEDFHNLLKDGFLQIFNSMVKEEDKIDDLNDCYELIIPDYLNDTQLLELGKFVLLNFFFVTTAEIQS